MVNARGRIPTGILAFSLLISGCEDRTKSPSQTAPTQAAQRVTALNDADLKRLQEQRAVVEKYLGDEDSHQKFQAAAGKLGTIRAILKAGILKPDQTYELQCLGVVLGDAFVQDLKMEWVAVEDNNGRDCAIRLPGTTVILFPLTMISKRIERGEQFDVFDLYNGVAAQVVAAQRAEESGSTHPPK